MKEDAYNHFEDNGILCQVSSLAFSMNFEPTANKVIAKVHENNTFYNAIGSELNLSEKETEKLVIDHLKSRYDIKISSINDLDDLKIVNGVPFLVKIEETDNPNLNPNLHYVRFCFAKGVLKGSIVLRSRDNAQSLGEISEITGDLGFDESEIKGLGKLTKIGGDFWATQSAKPTTLATLSNLEYVGGTLNLKNTKVQNLGCIRHVGGNLNLRKTNIKDLGKLKYVGGNVLMPVSMKGEINFDGIFIAGKVKYFNDSKLT